MKLFQSFAFPYTLFLLSSTKIRLSLSVYSFHHSEHKCQLWAIIQECEDNPEFMMENCKPQCDEWRSHTHGLDDIEDFYDLTANDIDGDEVDFYDEFEDKVVLITNGASYCSRTDQHYKELVELHEQLEDRDFEILVFPSNQFGNQEPDSPSVIKEFVEEKYGVEFRMMEKIDVNGSTSHIVYRFLKTIGGPFKIKGCFDTYFIVDAWGHPHEYTGLNPAELHSEIVLYLEQHEEAKAKEEAEF